MSKSLLLLVVFVVVKIVIADPFEQFSSATVAFYNLAANSPDAISQYKYLDGAVFCCAYGTTYLSPSAGGSYTGTRWFIERYADNLYGIVNTAAFLPGADQERRYLACDYSTNRVILTSRDVPRDKVYSYSNTWSVVKHGDNDYSFKCRPILAEDDAYLDGAVFPGTPGKVYISPSYNGGYTGTHWSISLI
ncbi:hypothetical protein PPL_02365 [Heterostelium album PN500]|uniref:Uncharacterized protein n=1 Tax=Heterostelium pallidum (strain ATCC 26659 / Pp 5 / PN500) TaxID=670386 RepID=D3AZI3_HETP5|nr:hypothetical protein PPL_02365 [Heterostelium album PN500]EFA85362.1 hypothetical protein PPL_02365 [Heterostelium album PN500]|eukprot:XP_020437471.1 hypothetical protein PPL_02365 [Heterostelium album PN500]